MSGSTYARQHCAPDHTIPTWHELVEHIYRTADDPGHWQVVARELALAFGGKSALLRTLSLEASAQVEVTYHHNMDDRLQGAYKDGLVREDPYLRILRRLPAGRMVHNGNMLDLDRIRHTPFYRQYMRPLDNHFIIGGFLNDEPGMPRTLVGVHRHSRAEPFSPEHLRALQSVVPHLRRTLWLQRTLQASRLQAAAAETVLEGFHLGAFLVDSASRLKFANTRGEALLRQDPRLRLAQGRVLAAPNGCNRGLQPLLELVVPAVDAATPSGGWSTVIRAACGAATELIAMATPVPERFNGLAPTAGHTLVVVGAAEETGTLEPALLGELYDMTNAEARLAVALAQGQSLQALSVSWGVSVETLRTHLKRALAKTRTTRQAELVRLLTGGPWNPPTHTPSDAAANDGENTHTGGTETG